jgi:hypothetical protein
MNGQSIISTPQNEVSAYPLTKGLDFTNECQLITKGMEVEQLVKLLSKLCWSMFNHNPLDINHFEAFARHCVPPL